MKAEEKREFEKQVVSQMIDMYYRKNGTEQEGENLKAYASMRIDKCPFMETKTFCSSCKVHCYRPEQRQQIQKVMRYSGPRMLLHHPVLAVRHIWLDHKSKIKKAMYLVIGFIGLFMGVVGAILPLLPAFPFLLMAAFGFGKSSQRLHNWFIETSLYKKNIKSWVDHKAMDMKTKIRVLTCISLVMLFGFVMMRNVPVGQAVLVLVWIGHLFYFIFRMKTLPVAE